MRKFVRVVGLGVLGLLAVAVGLVAVCLGYRAFRQHEIAASIAIHTPNGIDEATYVTLGGISQYITIRGENRSNPVLLYLMGGPGNTIIPRAYALYRPWERYFTVVQWDQRGAGRTWTRNGVQGSGNVSIQQIVHDGIELSELLRRRLGTEKIVLFGVSWGTLLGVEMIKERPDLFSFYVGSGQFVSGVDGEHMQYAALLEAIQAAHNASALEQVERIGPDYYTDQAKLGVERHLLRTYLSAPSSRTLVRNSVRTMAFAPGYSLWEQFVSFEDGTQFALQRLWPEVIATDLRSLGPDFAVPILLIQGADDWQTPTPLTSEYFSTIRAPSKEMVVVPGADHFVALVLPDTVLRDLVSRVRPGIPWS
jgi:pimeloyl-ACP methyl ester carboxylesterase